ncbi:MAG TPA: GNAT family N-acetyltransferase, partial [Candidatus Dormibacteraeota bacterium]|nr:GNAT family N-acetyltransferase [Candidatus Dormibacteraeota bacterium]
VGWLGGAPDHLHMHSHILGVLPDREAQGVGFDLKQHQRRWCLDREVRVMEWTTDPLIRRNVYFNVTKLGARAPEYLVDFYGQMRDAINEGEETDRLLIRWQLDAPRAGGEPDVDALRASGAQVVLAPGTSGAPTLARREARVLLCQVPDDVVELRRRDPGTARDWRRALRAAMKDAMDAGFALSGATKSGWYVLESSAT